VAQVLSRIGRPAFVPLVAAMAGTRAKQVRQWCRFAMGGIERSRKHAPDALTVAAAMSTTPLGPHTVRRGDGVLAVATGSREHASAPGALPI
jgi:hypothetical protein